MATSYNSLEQEVVRRAEALANTDKPTKGIRETSEENWRTCLSQHVEELGEQVELSDPMKEVVRRQGYSQNCAKPIGLFYNNEELIAEQDQKIANAPVDKKRASLIESFQWHAEEMDTEPPISSEVVIPGVGKVLVASELRTPHESWDELIHYVDQKYRKARRK